MKQTWYQILLYFRKENPWCPTSGHFMVPFVFLASNILFMSLSPSIHAASAVVDFGNQVDFGLGIGSSITGYVGNSIFAWIHVFYYRSCYHELIQPHFDQSWWIYWKRCPEKEWIRNFQFCPVVSWNLLKWTGVRFYFNFQKKLKEYVCSGCSFSLDKLRNLDILTGHFSGIFFNRRKI